MNIQFEEIKWKNLLSYGDEFSTLKIKNGVDLILGTNGQGKSSFADALFYGLFGKPFRKIKGASLINRVTKKKLEVQLIFTADNKKYKIIRGMKPAKFEIYLEKDKEFNLVEQLAATKDYQKFLEEEILLINETIFRQLIVLGANIPSSKPFMELSQQEKESLFQVITDTSIFNHLKIVMKNKASDKKHQLKDLEYKRDILKSSIDSEKLMVQQAEKQNDDFKEHHNENLKMTEDNIEKTNEVLVKYEDALLKLKELKIQYDEFQAEIANLTMDLQDAKEKDAQKVQKQREKNMEEYRQLLDGCTISEAELEKTQQIESEILEYKNHNQSLSQEKIDLDGKVKYIEGAEKSSVACKNCSTINYLTDICDDEVHKKAEYMARIVGIKLEINECTSTVKALGFTLRDYKLSVQNNLQSNKDTIEAKKKAMAEKLEKLLNTQDLNNVPLEAEITEVRSKAEKLKEKLLNGKRIRDNKLEQEKNLEYYENKLQELQSIKMIEINYDELNKKENSYTDLLTTQVQTQKDLDDVIYLETLINGNNLKGAVIKTQIPFLNKGINHFLELFSMLEYSFVIDENFKERLISRDIDSEFNQLSNGQKARISFSIMFAFLKLIEKRNGVKTNLLVLDEVLDSSVDAQGREELLQILKVEFSQTKDIIIISHNEQIKEKVELFDRMIHISKNKYSTLVTENL